MSKGLFGRLEAELEAREKSQGLTMSEVLILPDDQRHLINWLLRQKSATLAEAAHFLGWEEPAAQTLVSELVGRGLLREYELHGALRYRVRLAPKSGRTMPENLWRALDDKVEG